MLGDAVLCLGFAMPHLELSSMPAACAGWVASTCIAGALQALSPNTQSLRHYVRLFQLLADYAKKPLIFRTLLPSSRMPTEAPLPAASMQCEPWWWLYLGKTASHFTTAVHGVKSFACQQASCP